MAQRLVGAPAGAGDDEPIDQVIYREWPALIRLPGRGINDADRQITQSRVRRRIDPYLDRDAAAQQWGAVNALFVEIASRGYRLQRYPFGPGGPVRTHPRLGVDDGRVDQSAIHETSTALNGPSGWRVGVENAPPDGSPSPKVQRCRVAAIVGSWGEQVVDIKQRNDGERAAKLEDLSSRIALSNLHTPDAWSAMCAQPTAKPARRVSSGTVAPGSESYHGGVRTTNVPSVPVRSGTALL